MWLYLSLGLFGVAVTLVSGLAMVRTWRAWRMFDARVQDDARHTLDASFLFLDTARVWPVLWGVGAVGTTLAVWLAGSGWIALPMLGAFLAAPGFLLRRMRELRRRRFDAQLPDLVQALAGALRAGAGMQPALQHIVGQSLPPLSQEFSLLLREQRLGLGFHEALHKLRGRMPTESCGLVVSALGVAAQTGGSLADTLESLAQTLRMREHWLGRVRALTAQGRMQSRIMAGLPVLLLGVLVQLEPEAMARLWTTGFGWLVLCLILMLELIGIFWIRRIVDVEV
ncbi:MAG TPA: type II secretion system F family protein [Castellaniella sp.]|uniref:type II secretion system F family protein n=1 Tax=Castellaniella sp. TaxID=1955812 RepID=UPI002F2457EB